MAFRNLSAKTDAYHEQFAARIIAAIEAGTAPWQKPWKPGETFLPRNIASDRAYRGGNALHLATEATGRGYSDPRWGSYRQIAQAGGQVRKSETGTPIMYVDRARRMPVLDDRGVPVLEADGTPVTKTVIRDRPLVRVHHVFNVEQADGLRLPALDAPAPEWTRHARAEAILRHSGVRIDHVTGDRAFYRLADDRIVLPARGQFPTAAGYYQTALHELGHATGHPSRLDRPTLTAGAANPASAMYAREELRAEIASVMTGARVGVGSEPRHGAAYVEAWVAVLKDDPREIRAAAADAQRISDWLVMRERSRERTQTTAGAERPIAQVARSEPGRGTERGYAENASHAQTRRVEPAVARATAVRWREEGPSR